MENYRNRYLKKYNLLSDSEFILSLQFETTYGIAIRGGSLAFFNEKIKKKRMVNSVNLLNSYETQSLALQDFNNKN